MKQLQRKGLILLFAFFISNTTINAQSIEVFGDVSGVWNVDTVKVIDDISVPKNQTLEIEAGVVVEFQGYFHLEVKGSLQAIGEPSAPVIFTVNDTLNLHDISMPRGAWRGVIIEKERDDEDPQALFRHCHFEYAKTYEGDEMQHGGAVFIKDARNVSFDNCTFFRNHSYLSGGAIYFNGSSPLVVNCHFLENKAGHLPINNELYGYGGAVCGLHTEAIIRNNAFSNNWASGLGGGLSIDEGDPVIENNIFDGNDGPLGGGLGILRSTVDATISNNLVVNNFSMFFGGGMALIGTTATVANNTICNNSAPGAGGGALYFNDNSKVDFYNNIFWNNSASVASLAFVFDTSTPSFYFNNVQGGYAEIQGGGIYVFEDNIDENPQFVETGNHPFSLNSNSPCINAGVEDHGFLNLPETDLAGNPRVQLGRIDMGAYESAVSTVGFQNNETTAHPVSVYPNPARNYATIVVNLKHTQRVKLFLVDSKGQVAYEVFNGVLESGRHQFGEDLQKPSLGRGAYFVVFEAGETKTIEKLIVL